MQEMLDLLFPKKCIDCGKISEKWICDNCFGNIKYGKIEEFKEGEIKYLISLFAYSEIRDKMLKFKFNNIAYIKNYFVELVIRNFRIRKMIEEFDLIIPVPMYWKKKLKRGYNQSELIAKGISKELKIPMNNNVLIKYKNTKTQSLLDLEERKNNLRECFKLKNIEGLENKNVLLVDDIYTTGITINECVKKLKASGLRNISVFVIAKKEF